MKRRRRLALGFTLSREPNMRYSKGEQRIFNLLRGAQRSSQELAVAYYGTASAVPFNGRKIVIGLLRSLSEKITSNGEPFRLQNTARAGPKPMSFWLEGRPKRSANRVAA